MIEVEDFSADIGEHILAGWLIEKIGGLFAAGIVAAFVICYHIRRVRKARRRAAHYRHRATLRPHSSHYTGGHR